MSAWGHATSFSCAMCGESAGTILARGMKMKEWNKVMPLGVTRELKPRRSCRLFFALCPYAGQLNFDIIPWKLHKEAEGSEDSVLALCDEARVTARTIHSIETSKFHRRMNVFRGGRATAHHCAGRVTCTHVLSKGFRRPQSGMWVKGTRPPCFVPGGFEEGTKKR